jgi:phosphoenolpyruvate synthase/pyruvate phosphate dikinase
MHDRLRGSPLLFCAAVVDSLIEDANMNLGIRHEFFGKTVSGGLRGLNPGLARGVLKVPQKGESMTKLDPEGIYVLPATTAELSPVAGIVTAREGNALSHLQLLARNLGIPNVVVDKRLLPRLTEKEGVNVVLAVSPRGVVKIAEDSPKWDQVFIKEAKPEEVLIRPDFKKLNLKKRMLIPLERIRATDSGRIAGPKAANLGELKHQFPEAVTDGLVIPFGLFRSLLNQPIEPDGPPVFRWMQDQYAILQNMRDEPEKLEQATEHFLDRIHEWIVNADPGETYRRQLRTAMDKTFGPDGSYGLFVRSDTNLEDLPGFTGAGLNLTVPNVVGFENIVRAISRVWASPFTERAYAWRQAYMEDPEHVYVSVLLLKSIPADKSGVMVTTDLESGNPGWLSVAANQGVGGAVSGEGAEELRVNVESGKVRLMAQATEPLRRVLPSEGGVKKIPVIETDTVLENHEIAHLIELSRVLPDRFPAQLDAQGEPVPSDIEFGFYQGRLVLFQIRPFLESTHARQSHFLNALDQGLERVQVSKIELDKIPMEESQ